VSVAGASLALAQGPSPYYQTSATLPADVARQAAPVTADAGKTGAATTVPPGLLDGNGNGCGTGGHVCGRAGRFWGSIDYLAWWIKDAPAPPLVTIGSPNDFVPGAIGQPGTVVVGGSHIDYDTFSGVRFNSGMWFNDCQTRGMESSVFFLGQEQKN